MTLKKITFILVLFLKLSAVFSQDKALDSLEKIFRTHKEDTSGAEVCRKIYSIYMSKGNIDSCCAFAKRGYAISKKCKFIRGIAISCNYIGQVFHYHGNRDSSIYYFTNALTYYSELKDSTNIAGMLNNIGVVYRAHGNISKALDYYFKALKIKERQKDLKGIANTYMNIGHLFSEANDTANTIKYHKLSLELRKKINDKWGISNSYMAIGIFYENTEKLDQAMWYLKEALKIATEIGDEEEIAIGMYNLGKVYYSQNKMQDALELYKHALEISKKNNNPEGIATCLEALGKISMNKHDVKNAIKLFEEGYKTSVEIDDKQIISSTANNLSSAYELSGNYKEALFYHKIWINVKDSLFNQANTRKLTSEILKYEHEKEKIIVQKEQEKKEAAAKSDAFKKDVITTAAIFFLLTVSIFAFIIFKRLKENRKQKSVIEEQRNEMIDSINYAKRIQFALLAHNDLLKECLTEHFVLFNPKDIVSGDFYWATKKDNYFYLAVCDCTGHGVPGAFMSLLNINFLNEAINEKNISEPDRVLNYVRKRLLENMDGGHDGMDAVIIKVPVHSSVLKIEYAAANNAPLLVRNNTVIDLPKDKMPVGKGEIMADFTLHTVELQKNDKFYLYTDGYADQFGGPKGKKFKYKQLDQLILSNAGKPLEEQKECLNSAFENWKGNLEQIDDVCIIGIKY